MWNPSASSYFVRRTAATFDPQNPLHLTLVLEVEQYSPGASVWLVPADALERRPPKRFQDHKPVVAGPPALREVTATFKLSPEDVGSYLVPVVGKDKEGNSGSIFSVPKAPSATKRGAIKAAKTAKKSKSR